MGKLGKIKGKLRLYIKWPLYLTLLLLMAGLVVFAVTVTSFAPVTVSVLPKAMPPLLVIFTLPEQLIFVGLPQAGEPEFAVTVTSCAPVTVSGPGTTMPVPSLVSVTLPEQVISVTPAIAGLLTSARYRLRRQGNACQNRGGGKGKDRHPQSACRL